LRAVLLRGAELYREEADRAETLERYGKGTPDDWLERHLYGRHSYLGITLMLLLDLALLGPIGLTVWAVQMLWSPIFAAGVINGVGHYYGYRNAESPDASTNIVPWGILIGGEELHNNHHAWPGSARLSYQWWEFDIGWLYIRLLQAVGLARVKRVSPPPVQVVPAAEPDVEAVHAIINYRLQVLARYGSQVIKRIHREELRRVAGNRNLKGVFKRARDALLRDESLLDETARRSVGMVLGHSQALAAAVEFRRRLQAIWQQAAGQPEKALAALQQWCREAEASGNRYLQQFARQLAGYRRVGER
jgi:stearoyl-CoA desaturase (delta-9 desaturase)